ncbi:MAG: T9SS type B sorting domain-containing protein [Bacteroidales bacterium]|nr:T9SS type B sorting domain-containing protein [Bacteroidales bacterium]
MVRLLLRITRFCHTPNANYFGKDSAEYRICDSDSECTVSWLVITINEQNHLPEITSSATFINTFRDVTKDICFDISDGDNETLTFSPMVNHGIVVRNGNSYCFTYTPTSGYTGTDSIKVQVCDSRNACSIVKVRINVLPPGSQPVAKYDTLTLTTTIDKEVKACLEMTTPADGLTVNFITSTEHGSLEVESGLCLKYTPADGFDGTDMAVVSICNSYGLCDTVVLKIQVLQVKIPEGFSPNGDGRNDFFEIQGLESYDRVSLEIYNRWGSRVYEADAYENNWDGISKNKLTLGNEKLPSGTYFYVIHFHPGKSVVGFIYISR